MTQSDYTANVYSVQEVQGNYVVRPEPRLIIVEDGEPQTWYHNFSWPTHMSADWRKFEFVKFYGRIRRETRQDGGTPDKWDEITLQFMKENPPPSWNGNTVSPLGDPYWWGLLAPNGTYYPCRSYGHEPLAYRLVAVLYDALEVNSLHFLDSEGWVYVDPQILSARGSQITPEQAITFFKMLDTFTDSRYDEFRTNISEFMYFKNALPPDSKYSRSR